MPTASRSAATISAISCWASDSSKSMPMVGTLPSGYRRSTICAASSGSWAHDGQRSASWPTIPAGTIVESGSASSEYTSSTMASRSMARTMATRNGAAARFGLLRFIPKNSSAWKGAKEPSP